MSKFCKGTTKDTKGKGCGNPLKYSEHNGIKTYYAKYGLGIPCKCLNKWLLETEAGQEKIIESSRKVGMYSAQKARKENKEKKDKLKMELMTVNEYRSKVLQPVINHIARLIDYGCPCIATGNFGKENGGHYISVGSNPTIALNLHNIHIQSFESNHYRSGDTIKYEIGILDRYGGDYMLFMKSLHGTPTIKQTKEMLIAIKKVADECKKRLEKDLFQRTPQQRIEARNNVNEILGIYSKEFTTFKLP